MSVVSPSVQSFAYTGSNQTFTVPSGITTLLVKLWGAGGGAGNMYSISQKGGGGGFSSGLISVTPSEQLTVITGGKGITNGFGATVGGFGGGGNAGANDGGSGGGRSAIRRSSTELITAGAGGGGGRGPGRPGLHRQRARLGSRREHMLVRRPQPAAHRRPCSSGFPSIGSFSAFPSSITAGLSE